VIPGQLLEYKYPLYLVNTGDFWELIILRCDEQLKKLKDFKNNGAWFIALHLSA
jgi:hypothetical protein